MRYCWARVPGTGRGPGADGHRWACLWRSYGLHYEGVARIVCSCASALFLNVVLMVDGFRKEKVVFGGWDYFRDLIANLSWFD